MAFKKIKAAGGGADFDPKAEAVRLYEAGRSPADISAALNTPPKTVYGWLQRSGVLRGRSAAQEARSPHSATFKLSVIRRYEAGESSSSLGRELGLNPAVVLKWVRRRNGKTRGLSESKRVAGSRYKHLTPSILKLHSDGLSCRAIGKQIGISATAVINAVKRCGVAPRPQLEAASIAKAVSPAVLQRAKDMRAQGATLCAIAKALGVSKSSAARYVNTT